LATRPVDRLTHARNLTKAGKPAEAYEQFEEILKQEPRNLTAHRGLVEAGYYAGRLGEVSEKYMELARKQGTAGIGHYGLGLVAVARGPGNMQVALAEFAKAGELMASEADVPYRVGLIYLMNGDYPKAALAIKKALTLDPDRAGIRVAYAGALVQMGREKEGMETMRRILVLAPTPEEAKKARVISGKVFDPLRDIPRDVAQDLRKVTEHLSQDAVQQALALVEKVSVAHPKVSFAHTLQGLANSRLENNGEAIVCFERALELRPESPAALVGLGDVYARLTKWPEARQNYEKAIQLDPFDLEAHQRMGDLAKLRGEFDRAAESYGILVLLDPDNPVHRHRRAVVLVSAGQTWQAVNDYEEILGKNENNMEALVRLGSLYMALGIKDPARRAEFHGKARTCLQRAHELNPENEAVEEMLARLEE
jgi:tetratricopeptide (TPR) repeat protein